MKSLSERVKKISESELEEIRKRDSENLIKSEKHSSEAFKPKSNEELNAANPSRKKRKQATQEQLNNPLHGVKLAQILERLVDHYGWEYLAKEVNINCFKNNPSMKSSLGFLRKMKWARDHVEDVYLDMLEKLED